MMRRRRLRRLLKGLPAVKLLAVAQVAMLARDHIGRRLDSNERRRLAQLVWSARGRPSTLSQAQRDELATLVAKAEPRVFAGQMAEKLSPVPLPERLVYGPRRRP